jgi:NitT/TauT family transport system permease protein
MTDSGSVATATHISAEVQAPTPPEDSAASSRKPFEYGKVIGPIVVFGLIVGAWYFVSDVILTKNQQFMMPPPHQIVKVYFNGGFMSELMSGLKYTTEEALLGLLISSIIGIGIATLMSQAKWIEQSIYPWAVVLQSVPILALTGVLSFFFGFSLTSRVIVCVLISFFPMISNTLFGLQSADASMHDLFTLHHASRFTRLWKLQLRAALPAIFAGLRVSAGLSVIGAIVGDIFFKQGNAGIGTLLSTYTSYLEGDRLFAGIGLSCALAILLFLLSGWASKVVVGSWYNPKKD